ncbi:Nuclear transport factor 2 family protein [Sulfidibacter corallicola]|uniref:Nuclear transport factor 2 family protein n=1 Tax=Sulfidibacter corallicola TaxID=2818388 RepID=A0A8A4TMA4_SULCO|nr:nuclear transport factor 2 family protein [Sulfidibacter corallicola]QTD50683.1 nuclear transport factor 2 family protein [Sulfidibacter corallicola]
MKIRLGLLFAFAMWNMCSWAALAGDSDGKPDLKAITDVAAADKAAILAAVRDYQEGQFTSNPERVKRALHPNLFKYRVKPLRKSSQTETLDILNAQWLIAFAAENEAWAKGRSVRELNIVYQDKAIAVVHAVADDFYDVCMLAKINGAWRITAAAWDFHEGFADWKRK